MTIAFLLVAGALLLAYANGANDNFKGVATLFGSATCDYRRALAVATVATLLGSLTALVAAKGLLAAFSGKGLVSTAALADPAFLPAVAVGAAATILLATRLGMPVSTTHALVGALIGGGVAAVGSVHLAPLAHTFLVPLLASPVIAVGAAALLYPLLRGGRRLLGVGKESCLCVGETGEPALAPAGGACATPLDAAQIRLTAATVDECASRYTGRVVGVEAQSLLDGFHYASAAAVSFARGLNDTPKIAALLLGVGALGSDHAIIAVAVAIAAGGLIAARRVAETLGHGVTTMNDGQGFTANAVTAFLVIVASRWGVPVSTTHVSTGALIGIGAATGGAKWRMITTIGLAWVATLPVAAVLAATTFTLLSR